MPENNSAREPFDGIKELHKKAPAYFNILYFGLIIWGLIFSAYFIVTGWSSHDEFARKMSAHEQKYSGEKPSGYGN